MPQESNLTEKNNKKIYVVIDTNVFVSALISRNEDAATVRVFNAFMKGIVTPLYHEGILAEYDEVLHRPKFHFNEDLIRYILIHIKKIGIRISPTPTEEEFIDKKDVIFYEVVLTKKDDGAWLVTGNDRHFPKKHFVVTPREFMDILDGMNHYNNM